MKKLFSLLLFVFTIILRAQVGINTETPSATLDIIGKPDLPNHYDGIIPPRITGDQLATKNYSVLQKGAIVYVTQPASNLLGQVIHIVEEGYYYFNGQFWNQILTEPTYYDALVVLDETLPINTISEQTSWNKYLPFPTNPRQHTLSTKIYRLGTSGLGITGEIDARRIGTIGYLDVSITCSAPINSNYIMLNLSKPLRDLGFMTSGSVGSLNNILVSGSPNGGGLGVEQGIVSLTNVDFHLLLWKNQIEKFNGKIKGMTTFPINYLNVVE
ncbi:hypothetical protein EGY07_06385 [Chryseobacterium indologenes]|uniref:Uncharacterized protein n=1 Tax=Chryseobacterium oryzae TaxID=2929799 RepID=A0ABY4BE38_9FLAO|nr:MULTISPECIES: hypothetical protein [Chryseobacterium]AYZ35227.1 hypothetical protein EGY07_06385 [Chryseobacterium indologenes]MEB4761446.1 hypothetical protein [Chryseobacterium indologenes]OCK51406.1 hypothetical protein BA768_16575 [Chryseobacterium sp. CBo1]UEQ78019.1 hypothetical protein J8N07_06880 [Chryseobacterium arthrosphaerae]UOE37432.1 hypothetical protein MTP08_10175 [Chryseobacterium oryzae]